MEQSILFGVILFGLLHGLEPRHGWPLTFLYSIKKDKAIRTGFITAAILASSHFFSSFVVVVAFVVFSSFITIPMESIEGGVEDQHEHLHGNKEPLEHEHPHTHLDGAGHMHAHAHAKTAPLSLAGLTTYALLLGFAHEEEFALLALVAAGADPWVLIIDYAGAVSGMLITITIICIKFYEYFLPKLQKYKKYIPKLSAIILLGMTMLFLLNLI